MNWRWTEEGRLGEWERWPTQGKAAFLWRVCMLRLAFPWAAMMLIYFLFFAPDNHELRELPFIGYVQLLGVTAAVSILFGLVTGLLVWRQMGKKYG
jgi:hypothetical protein